MRTVEERAQDFVSNGEYSPTLKECYIAGAAEEHLLLTHWNNIEADKDGFTTNKAYAEITASVLFFTTRLTDADVQLPARPYCKGGYERRRVLL